MTSIFEAAAKDYEAHNLAVFPIVIGADGKKKPAIKNPASFRPTTWHKLSPSLLQASGVGLWCGRQNNITIVDIDTGDQSVLDNVINTLGDSPIKAQTPSGGQHHWFRWHGERRAPRYRKDLAVDILGSGGMAVCPPSLNAASGGCYRFLEGSLDDLGRLPIIRHGALPDKVYNTTSNLSGNGNRNNILHRFALRAVYRSESEAHLGLLIQAQNDLLTNQGAFSEPLPMDEIASIAASVWQRTERGDNWVGGEGTMGRVYWSDLDRLKGKRDAKDVWELLVRTHAEIRNEVTIAVRGPGGGITALLDWKDPQRTRNALEVLCDRGFIHLIEKRPHKPARYAFCRPFPIRCQDF